MKFHIRNLALLSLLAFPVCGAPKKAVSKPRSRSVLVFQRSKKLEAINLATDKTSVLRDSFLYDNEYRTWGDDWKFSPDRKQVAFSAFPRDVDFFSAASWRRYLWTSAFNQKQRVLLAAYGKRATKRDYSFFDSSWSVNGKQLILSRQIIGNYPEPGEVAIYEARARRELWNSHAVSAKILPPKAATSFDVTSPALSPDSKYVVCLATESPAMVLPQNFPMAAKRLPL